MYVSIKPKEWDKDKENQVNKKIGVILLVAIGIILFFSDFLHLFSELLNGFLVHHSNF